MKTFTYKQFTSRRKPNEHTRAHNHQQRLLEEGKKTLVGGGKPLYQSKEDLQFEIIPAILELQRTESKALFEKTTLKGPKALNA